MKPTARLRSFLCIASSVLLTASYAHATNLYWDSNTTTAGAGATPTGTWGTSNFWNTDPLGGAVGAFQIGTLLTDDLFFVADPGAASGNNAYTVTVSGAQVANSLTFQASGATTLSGGTSITLGNGTPGAGGITMNQFAYGSTAQGAVTITTSLILANSQTWTNNAAAALSLRALNLNGNALTVSGTGVTTFDGNAANIISGAGGIVKNGSGSLILDGGTSITHTFTGGITITGGSVRFQNATNVSSRGNVSINGGYLGGRFNSSPTFAGGLGTGATAIQILGGTSGFSGEGGTGSTFLIGTAGSVLKWGATGVNGATGFFNPSVLLLGGDQGMNTNAKGSLNNGIDLNGTDRTITSLHSNGDGAATTGFAISGVISNSTGTAGFEKTGPGNIILGNANTYNGTTTITGGSLTVGNTASLGSGASSNTLVFNGGTLLANAAFNSVATRGVTMTSTGIINTNTFAVGILGDITGAGGLTKNSTGTLTLSGTNSYGGVTTVNAGTLAITKEASLYNAIPASWTAANINVKNGAGLALNVDSAGTAGFTSANLSTLLGNILVANTAAQGLQSGATLSIDTSTAAAGTFTLGSAITNSSGAFGGTINLVKLGAGTLVLDQINTNTGTTTITAGTIQYNDGGAISSKPLFLNGGTFAVNRSGTATQGSNIPAIIGGTGGLANVGSGSLVINAPTYHTGNTAATAGNITLSHARAIQFSALDTTGTGTVTLSGVTAPVFGGLANSGTARNLASVIDSSYASVTNLTLNPQSGSTFTYSGVIADGAAGMDLTKTGAGTQSLTGTNTYTGETYLNGGTLALTGAAGALSGTTGITLNGGTLALGPDLNNNRVNDSANISSNGGTIAYDINNSSINTETVGTLDLVRGQFNLTEAFSLSSGSSTFTFSGLTRTGATNTSAVNLQAKNTAFSTGGFHRVAVGGIGANTPTGEIAGPWMTTTYSNAAASDYVVYSNGGSGSTYYAIGAAIAASAQSGWSTDYTTGTGTLNNTLANANGSAANGRLDATRNINSLRNTTAAGGTISTVAATDVVTMTGSTFQNGDVIVLGTSGQGLTAGVPYYVRDVSGATFKLAATSGGSAVDITGSNTGTLTAGITLGANNLGTSGILNGSTTPLVIGGSSGAVTLPTTTAGNLFVTAGAGSIAIHSPINNNTGALTLVKNGSNTLTLGSTTSDYSGGTVLNAGTLQIGANTNLGVAGTGITLDGSATLSISDLLVSGGNVNLGARTLTLNNGAIATFNSWGGFGRGNFTIGGAVTGSGGVAFTNNSFWQKAALSSTANTFSGPISVNNGGDDGNSVFSINSIADGAGYGAITLNNTSSDGDVIGLDYGTGGANGAGGGGATAALTLNHRQIIVASNGNNLINNSSNQDLTINTDLGFSGTGARSIRFGVNARAGSGISTFAGKLTDNVGGALSPSFAGGTWIVSNNNNYTGNTGVSAGNVTFSGNNSHTGQITVSGATGATLTLSGNNSGMSGNVVLSTATGTVASSPLLNINSATALGTGILNFGGGAASDVVRIDNTSAGAVTVSTANAITMNRNFTFIGTQNLSLGTGTTTLGGMTSGSNRSITVTANTLTLGGTIAEATTNLGIAKAGAGTLLLSGSGNSYTGATTVTGGILASTVAVQGFGTNLSGISIGGSGTLSLRNDSTVSFTNGTSAYNINNSASGATINVDRVTGTGSNTITVGNLTTTSTAVTWQLNFTGSNGVNLNAGALTTPTAAAGSHTINNNIAGGGELTLASVAGGGTGAAATLIFTGSANTKVSGAITQVATAQALTKNGAGTLLLNGTNSYTGLTTVNAGTLGGTGTIAGAVTVAAAGNLAPGASVGTLTINNNLTVSAMAGGSGVMTYELGPIASSDKIAITGTLDIGAGTLGFNNFAFSNLGGLQNGTYKLITSGAAVSGTLDGADLTGAVGSGSGTLQISGNDLELVVTGIGAGSPYDTWATSKGLTGANNAKTDDPDNDGRNNLAEFAFDGNPLSGVNDGKIVGKVAAVGPDQVMTLTLPVRTGATFADSSGDELSALIDGIYYRVEGDVNLGTFANNITEVTGGAETPIQAGLPALSSGWTYRTFRDSGTVPTVPKVFLRAKISETP